MLKALLAVALLLIPGPSTADEPAPSPAPIAVMMDAPTVQLVNCDSSAGSAFRIGPHTFVSAAHVTSDSGCTIGGQSYQIKYQGTKLDYSILTDDRTGPWIDVDCNGFVKGHTYIAIGHPRILAQSVAIPMVSTGMETGGEAVLVGILEAQPGMSGGAIIDAETLKVVGIVNMAEWEDGLTFSLELKNTSVCAKPST